MLEKPGLPGVKTNKKQFRSKKNHIGITNGRGINEECRL